MNLATLIESADDLIYNMGWDDVKKPKKNIQSSFAFIDLTDEQKVLYDIIKEFDDGIDIDSITIKSNIPGGKVAGILLQMEFAGILKSLPGKIFQLN
jgi:DNA processing protein